ncbi:hypothetical protein B7463_g9150, partial [Scytalidium lignicola]
MLLIKSKISQAHHRKTPADSDISALKSVIDKNTNKNKEIDERKANLPLPDQPPVASDWQSLSQESTGTGSGQREGLISGENNSALREPAGVESSVRATGGGLKKNTQPGAGVGRQGTENLDDLPKDERRR